MERFCRWCAEKFETKSNTQRFCSKRCSYDFKNYEGRLYTENMKALMPEPFNVIKAAETAERQSRINREAKALGLSYGKYMAYINLPAKKRKRFLECNMEV